MKTDRIILVLVSCVLAVFALLGWRLFYLQHNRARYFAESSERQRQTVVAELPRRGLIMDRRGRILAASNQADAVFAEPRVLTDMQQLTVVSERLGQILGYPGNRIGAIISGSANPGYVRIAEDISQVERDRIELAGLKGIGVQTDWRRYYPMGGLTSHLVGFIGTEQTGLAGAELTFDAILRGRQGSIMLFVDASRRPIAMEASGNRVVEDGMSVVLTIDSTIQQFARKALFKQYEDYKAESAVAIVMDPKDGAVLAMVSLPDFEPAQFQTARPDILRNRAITDPFEPGSVFKPFVAALALDYGAITTTEKFYCENGYFSKYRIGEYGGKRYGDMDVKGILTHSSNIGMAKIGLKMGKDKLYDGVRLFGFGEKTGIELSGEDTGLVKTLDKWSGYTPTRIPFGHEISITAMQLARAYCTLANGGRIVKPHLLKSLVDCDGNRIDISPPEQPNRFIIKPHIARWIIREAMTAVVREGTGTKAAIEGVEVFGKTGTANIAGSTERGYDESNYVASFVGGAPAKDPAVIILVSIRKPQRSLGKGYTGGTVAAPVFREILEDTLKYMGLAQTGEEAGNKTKTGAKKGRRST